MKSQPPIFFGYSVNREKLQLLSQRIRLASGILVGILVEVTPNLFVLRCPYN